MNDLVIIKFLLVLFSLNLFIFLKKGLVALNTNPQAHCLAKPYAPLGTLVKGHENDLFYLVFLIFFGFISFLDF